jgi:hypothetical protein
MKALCIKDVVMERGGETAFVMGKSYETRRGFGNVIATNEQGNPNHQIIVDGDITKKWFNEHFRFYPEEPKVFWVNVYELPESLNGFDLGELFQTREVATGAWTARKRVATTMVKFVVEE